MTRSPSRSLAEIPSLPKREATLKGGEGGKGVTPKKEKSLGAYSPQAQEKRKENGHVRSSIDGKQRP